MDFIKIFVRRYEICRNKLYLTLGWDDALEKRSKKFWSVRSDTHIAGESYYIRRAAIVSSWLEDLPALDGVLDIGSGDGVFTLFLARNANHVYGFDISPSLVESAKKLAKSQGVTNVDFSVSELSESATDGSFDLVACLGVTSCILDERKHQQMLDAICAAVAPQGFLLMIDTVGTRREHIAAHGNGYVARYRHADKYLENVTSRNMTLVKAEVIQDWSSKLSNRISLFRKI